MFGFFKKQKALQAENIMLEHLGEKTSDVCPCCNNITRTIWGAAHVHDKIIAVYYVHWTQNSPVHGAHIDLILGDRNQSAPPVKRSLVTIEYRVTEGPPSFMVVNGNENSPALDPQVTIAPLLREQVVGTPLAKDAFAIIDAIWLGDSRIDNIHTWTLDPQ